MRRTPAPRHVRTRRTWHMDMHHCHQPPRMHSAHSGRAVLRSRDRGEDQGILIARYPLPFQLPLLPAGSKTARLGTRDWLRVSARGLDLQNCKRCKGIKVHLELGKPGNTQLPCGHSIAQHEVALNAPCPPPLLLRPPSWLQ